MAAEARAMLDALMGSDRNAAIPKSGHNNLQRTKKSCYDRDICPLYCAWGVDVYELFTNTKSDLGPNPSVVRDDARDEWLGLPDHEKDRLGYEVMLHRKLGELVRNCDRIVNRNKEKLRVEIAKAAKARGAAGRTIDPATDVDEGMLAEAAEVMADLELREEEVSRMLQTLMDLDGEWKGHWDTLKALERGSKPNPAQDPGSAGIEGAEDKEAKAEETNTSTESENKSSSKENESENKGEKNDNDTKVKGEEEEDKQNSIEAQSQKEKVDEKSEEIQIKELKSKLYKISAQQQKIISSLSILTSQTIVPLRDNLQNLTKQLHYVKTDTSSDKTVCEVSGNFMSSRDAEERIAAHYAGKQYVGWKMVRDKFRELNKKYSHGRPMGGGGGFYGGGGGPRGGGGGYGGRGGRGGGGYGYNNHGYGINRQPMGGGHGPPPPGYGGAPSQYGRNNDRRRERSRSRDRDGSSSSRSRHHRRRSPSPPRWKRDRGYGGRR